jgi:hypothetical protein
MKEHFPTLRAVMLTVLLTAGCEIPQQQKIADCLTNDFDFAMTIRYGSPYEFLLGVPHSQTDRVEFTGQIILTQSTGVVARIPISSHDMRSCNWLQQYPDLAAYILTWSRTNQGERLDDLLVRKQTYNVHVRFTNPPPPQSSLWLSSISRPWL